MARSQRTTQLPIPGVYQQRKAICHLQDLAAEEVARTRRKHNDGRLWQSDHLTHGADRHQYRAGTEYIRPRIIGYPITVNLPSVRPEDLRKLLQLCIQLRCDSVADAAKPDGVVRTAVNTTAMVPQLPAATRAESEFLEEQLSQSLTVLPICIVS